MGITKSVNEEDLHSVTATMKMVNVDDPHHSMLIMKNTNDDEPKHVMNVRTIKMEVDANFLLVMKVKKKVTINGDIHHGVPTIKMATDVDLHPLQGTMQMVSVDDPHHAMLVIANYDDPHHVRTSKLLRWRQTQTSSS